MPRLRYCCDVCAVRLFKGEIRHSRERITAMNAEVFAAIIDSVLQALVRDSGLNLSYTFKPHRPNAVPVLTVEFAGPDVPALVARNAELLLAFEHIAVEALRLESEHHDLINFEAGGFKAARERGMRRAAEMAVNEVKSSGQPYHFAPMNSRERRLLHLALAQYGMHVESEGEGPLRHVVVQVKPGP